MDLSSLLSGSASMTSGSSAGQFIDSILQPLFCLLEPDICTT